MSEELKYESVGANKETLPSSYQIPALTNLCCSYKSTLSSLAFKTPQSCHTHLLTSSASYSGSLCTTGLVFPKVLLSLCYIPQMEIFTFA